MADEQYTRCPSCRTVFRVTPQQLELRGGQVRCGHCQTVFDGVAQLVSVAPPAELDDDIDRHDEAAPAPPTMTPRSAQALLSPPSVATAVAPETAATAEAAAATPPAPPLVGEETAPPPPGDETSPPLAGDKTAPPLAGDKTAPPLAGDGTAPPPRPGDRRRYARAAYAVAVAVLALLLMGQAAFHFRESIAARWPAWRPVMTRACAELGCTVGAPRDIGDLAIEASDLQADPAHQGLLILTATVRNRGPLPLAYPYLELTLTDAQDRIVVRRAFAPSEYAGGTTDLARGIPANGEVAIKLFIDASATAQAGYRLYLFYG